MGNINASCTNKNPDNVTNIVNSETINASGSRCVVSRKRVVNQTSDNGTTNTANAARGHTQGERDFSEISSNHSVAAGSVVLKSLNISRNASTHHASINPSVTVGTAIMNR